MTVKNKTRLTAIKKCPLPACRGYLRLRGVYATATHEGTEQYHTSPAVCSWCGTSLPQAMNPKRRVDFASNRWLIDQRYKTVAAAIDAATAHANMWLKEINREEKNRKEVVRRPKKRKVQTNKNKAPRRR